MSSVRYSEYGKFTAEWANFHARAILGTSIIADGDAANLNDLGYPAANQPDWLNPFSLWSPIIKRNKNIVTIGLSALRAEIGRNPILLKARLALYSYYTGGPYSATVYAHRMIATGVDDDDCDYRYKDISTLTTWYGGAYGVVPGKDCRETPFDTVLWSGTGYATSPDIFIDVTDELAYALQRQIDLKFLLKVGNNVLPEYARAAWNVASKRPHLQIWRMARVEFFQVNGAGTIDMTKLVASGDEDDAWYLGAYERSETGSAVGGMVKNLTADTIPHVEIGDDHPEWSAPVQTAGTGTGLFDYILQDADATSQKYTLKFTSATEFDVKAEAYRDNSESYHPSYTGGDAWSGDTATQWDSPDGGIHIPVDAWHAGFLVGDYWEFYVKGNTTLTEWPADSNDQVQMARDDGGGLPDAADWRTILGRRTLSTAAVTIDAATKKIPVRPIVAGDWTVGALAHIADASWIDEGNVASVAEETIEAVAFVGAGLNDATSGGHFYGATFHEEADAGEYRVRIKTEGTPDIFEVSTNGGTSYAGDYNCAITPTEIGGGVTIVFAATTGHTATNYWKFDVTPYYVELENLAADSHVFPAGANVSTWLPIRALAATPWTRATAEFGVSGSPANRVYVEDVTGFSPGNTVFILDLLDTDVYETMTVLTVGLDYLNMTANFTLDFSVDSWLVRTAVGEEKFHQRVVASAGSAEELKQYRLNIRT